MSYWNAGAAAGGAIAGSGVLGGGGQDHIGTDEYYADWMQDDVKNLAKNINDLEDPQYYGPSTLASQNPWMQQSLGDMNAWGQPGGQGDWMANRMRSRGNANLTGYGQAYTNAEDLQSRGANQFQYDQGTFDQTMGNLMPGVQNAFNVGARDIQQGYDYNQLPGLKMNDALGGGYGGTKGLQQSALGQAQTAGNIQQLGSGLWQNAANQANQGAMSAGGQNLVGANQYDQSQYNNWMGLGKTGAGMLNNAYGMGRDNLGIGGDVARIQQGYDQSVIDADKARWDYEQNAPWQSQEVRQGLTQSWNPQGSNPYQPASGGWQDALDGGMAGLGLYDAWNSTRGGGGVSGGGVLPNSTTSFDGNYDTYGTPGYLEF